MENILNNREEAEECVNDAYLKLRKLIPPNRPQVLGTFLCKLVRYTAIDMIRAKHTSERGNGKIEIAFEELEECIPDKYSVESAYESKEIISEINDFLTTIPVENRRIFILRYWYCCDLSEIAKRLGTRQNTISVILNRTRKRLREYLERKGFEP